MVMQRDFWINSWILGFLWGISCRLFFCYESMMFYVLSLAVLFWTAMFGREIWALRAGRKFVLVILAGILLGMVRIGLDLGENRRPADISGMTSRVANVVGLPDKKGQFQEVLLQTVEADSGAAAKLLARFDRNEPVEYGQKILVEGFRPDWDELDEKKRIYLFRRRLDGFLESARINKKLGLPGRNLLSLIYDLRVLFLGSLSSSLAEPAASLISGILVGERGSLPEQVAADFQATGLSHILAISGFNITIIINLVILLTTGRKKIVRFWCAFSVIVFFVILTGASASVVRAGVMGIMMLLVRVLERRTKILKIILLSAFLIVCFDPRLLNFDLSFQLSVFATLSLVLFSEYFEFFPEKDWRNLLWDGIATTLAAQVITLPFLFYYFGRVSLISPLANLAVGPLIPFLMLIGVAVLLTGLIWPVLALPLVGVTEILVRQMLNLVGILADLPLAQIEFGKGQTWLVIVYYSLVFILFRRRKPVPG